MTTQGDHPNGNYWFAYDVTEEEQEDSDGPVNLQCPWRVLIQLSGDMVDRLDMQFLTREDAEAFIRNDILGAGAQFGSIDDTQP